MLDITVAVVPVAGLGTRLLPATKSQPKEMLPGRPPARGPVRGGGADGGGIERVLFVTGRGKTSIENHFDTDFELIQSLRESGKEELLAELEFERARVQYFYTRQRETLGLGHAVLCARPFVGGEPFVVALGDSILGLDRRSTVVRRMVECFVEKKAAAVVAFERVPRQRGPPLRHRAARAAKATSSRWRTSWRSRARRTRPASWPSPAATCSRPSIFDALQRTSPGKGGEIQLTDAIRIAIKEGGHVYGMCLSESERRFDVGNFDSYFRAFVEFALADPNTGPPCARP
jgi:UTP--glucose-1-phosphate uridylyltransferase